MGKKDHKRKSVPATEGDDISALAKLIKSNKCKNVVFMLGAGVSTSAGIPDFRTPGTGLYSNLERLKLPYPEAVFEINYFRRNPVPFYTLARELYPGKFRPTITHSFIRLLAQHGLLHSCFTQNIDTLERIAGVPEGKIIEAHGSFATQRCIDCSEQYDDEAMKQIILNQRIPYCTECRGLVKPDIVFFGEALPDKFINSIPVLAEADLLIVIGTSLTVHPFASLAQMPNRTCPRVLINMDRVSDFGRRPGDMVFLGKCDDTIVALAKELGWHEELEALWEDTASSVEDSSKVVPPPTVTDAPKDEPSAADAEVEELATVLSAKMGVGDQDSKKPNDDKVPEDAERPQTPTAHQEKEVAGSVVVQGEPLPIHTTPPSTPKRVVESGDAKDEGKL